MDHGLAQRIREAIAEGGIDDLAKRSKVSKATIYNLLAGYLGCRMETLRKLHAAGVKIPRNLFGS